LSEFISCVANMSDEDSFASDSLRELYEAIVTTPLEFEM